MTDEANIAQQRTQIPPGAVRCPLCRGVVFYYIEIDQWRCRTCHATWSGDHQFDEAEAPSTDTPARHGGSSAAEARADQSDAASESAQARGVAPTPAQGLETASGGHSLLTEREMDVLDDFLNAHRDDIEHGINDFGDLRPLLPWLDGAWPRV